MKEEHIKVKGHRIRFLEDGMRNLKYMICLHGLGAAAERWRKVIPIFAKAFHVVAPDLIGFGYSDKPVVNYTIPFFVDFVKKFADTLEIKSFTLMGYSFGGHISAEFAIKYEKLLEKLVLVVPAGIMKQPTPALSHYMTAALYPTFRNANTAFQEMTGGKKVDERYIHDFIKRMKMHNAKHAFISSIMCSQNAQNLAPRLRKIKIPTLIIWGKKDPLIPVKYAKDFHSNLKGSKLVVMKDCGYTPFYEKPLEFSEIVLRFLNK